MRNYEIMFILNPNTPDEEIEKISSQMQNIVTTGGGTVQKAEKMGKRRLAYEVRGFREGFYMLFAFLGNGDIVREFERRLRVMDPVIKYLTVRMDDEIQRIEKLRKIRQQRSAARSSRRAATAEASPEEALG